MPTTKPIVIMGAGPAGLTAAFQLVRAGLEVIVWEADPSYVGGVSRTVQAETYRIDMGGHRFFSKNEDVTAVWRQIMVDEFVEGTRLARIYDQGKFLEAPFNAVDAAKLLGVVEMAGILSSYFAAQMSPIKPEENFAQWATNRFGARLFEKYIKSYSEKVWGVPCDQVPVERGANNRDGISIASALAIPFVGTGRPEEVAGAKFHYPRLGPGQMWETAANKILERGAGVFLDRKVKTIHWDETGVTHITGIGLSGEFFQQEGSHFLSSLPLGELMLSLDPPPPKEVTEAAKALRYRAFITVCLIVDRVEVFPDLWIYLPDPAIKAARVQNYKNWSKDMVPDAKYTSLGMEYFCSEGDIVWNTTDFDMAQLAIREATKIGLVKESEIKDAFVVRTPKAYPVYDKDYSHNLEVIKQWVGLFANLQPLGRNGMHKSENQDQSMMTAMLAVRNIQGGHFDCWKVNGDAQYQESLKT